MTAQSVPLEEQATGPSLRGAHQPSRHLRLIHGGSQARPDLSEEDLQRAHKLGKQSSVSSAQRIAVLGLVLAKLANVPFDRAALLFGVKPHRLEQMLHGEMSIPGNYGDRWQSLLQIFMNLERVLDPAATNDWLDTAVPDLGGRTPLQAVQRNDIERVVAVTESYLDPNFS